jgi:hypothetical protein
MNNTRTISIKKYYSSLPNMLNKYDRFARKDKFNGSTIEEFENWKVSSRKNLWNLLGLDKMDSVALNPSVIENVNLDNGIVRRKVIIQSEEDVYVPMYILIPPHSKGTFIAPPGHQGAGKYSIVGMKEIPAVADAIKKFNYDYGLQLAQLGFSVVCPDCRGFGERRDEKKQGDEEENFLTSSCFHLAHMAEPIGETVVGMCTWDLMRIIDYIQSQDDLKDDNLSCLGFSGGGMQTLYLCALDKRVKNVFISGYMYGFKDSLMILNGNCNCNYVPHLWEHFDMGDIGSLIAPRNLMIQSCREDHLNGPRGLENVYEQVEIIKNIYALYGRTNLPIHDICDGGHKWHDEHLKDVLIAFNLL